MKRKLNQYKSVVSTAQITKGINAANANAQRLWEDATLLFQNSRFASAVSLAILSIEESGKEGILRSLALAKNSEEIQDGWREYRSHTCKNRMWLLMDLFQQGARSLRDFKPLFEKNAEHPFILDNLKQIGFYTDCLGEKANWSIPSEVIDENLAKNILQLAKILLSTKEISQKEIELWTKYLKPVWKQNMELMEAALTQWFREMCKEGLILDNPDSMEKFIVEGFPFKK